jgi:hypothetical protein
MWGWFCVRFAPPLELICGFCPTCMDGGDGVVWRQIVDLEDSLIQRRSRTHDKWMKSEGDSLESAEGCS